MIDYRMVVNGELVGAQSAEWPETNDPYQGTAWARIPKGAAADAERAVAAAKHAMTSGPWALMSASARGKIMRRVGDLVAQHAERLAEIETRDNGKLLKEMLGQMSYIAECWYYFAGLCDKVEGTAVPVEKPDTFAFTTREPVGVVVALTAWNSPVWFATIKAAPAMAAGCAVVVKPSEFASASTIELAMLMKEAGVPDGVFNVVTGLGQEIGPALVAHPDVAKITFTGSDETGIRIYEAAAKSMKRVSLELGGKSPNIVFEDADLDAAASGVVSGIFGATGQMCTAGSRLLVQSSIKEKFTEKLLAIARAIKLGDPKDPATDVGPVATPPQLEKVLRYIDIANADGAKCILGGTPGTDPDLKGGQFVQPTIFTEVRNDMRIAQEEVFGPILSIIAFDTEADAIEIGNDVAFGLVAGVWTTDIGRALRMSKALKVGNVWVNTYRAYSYMMPFGGMKRSGLGREGGIEAISEYLDTKSVMISTASSVPQNLFVMR